MQRRHFLKSILTITGLNLLRGKNGFADDIMGEWGDLQIWAYYVPLLSYDDILEPTTNPLDRKVIFEEVVKQTSRISGRETDGTENTDSFDMAELEAATPEYLRIRFWHDDSGGSSGHTLHFFKRYLTDLKAGKDVFVATGMYQSHFHVVMIEA